MKVRQDNMMMKHTILVLGWTVLLACDATNSDEVSDQGGEIEATIVEDTFDAADTAAWVVESENGIALQECVSDGVLTMNVPEGITIWNTTRFSGDVMFEFEATAVKAGGANDRVSDLNCFWMATDPENPDQFFARSAWRKGIFWRYYTLNLYYVGYGGHDNTRTRMRRYDVSIQPPPPPVIAEYADARHLLEPNKRNLVRIVCRDSKISYYFNDEKLFEFTDENPYTAGYFGFRTTNSHIRIDNFKAYALRPDF